LMQSDAEIGPDPDARFHSPQGLSWWRLAWETLCSSGQRIRPVRFGLKSF
jgi:hypothetical protein